MDALPVVLAIRYHFGRSAITMLKAEVHSMFSLIYKAKRNFYLKQIVIYLQAVKNNLQISSLLFIYIVLKKISVLELFLIWVSFN